MITQVLSLHLNGLDVLPVHAEALVEPGPGITTLHGFTEYAVRESRVRLRAALQQVGVDFANHTITLALSPSEPKRSGGSYDLALAVAVLAALGRIPSAAIEGVAFLGELSLTGAIRPIRGVLPALRGAVARGITRAVVPVDNAREAALVPGIEVRAARHLSDVIDHFATGKGLHVCDSAPPFSRVDPRATPIDLGDVRGQPVGRRALEIVAAGGHDLLLMGPTGAGKTMLARRLTTILPAMTPEETLDVTAMFSVSGQLGEAGIVINRPFRAPHHTVSAVGLAGGGDPVRPGEVSLAHHGVLFLDELHEFKGSVLETLRAPMENGFATICRASTRATFPSRPIFVGAVAPCPCGHHGNGGLCGCPAARVKSFRGRLRGPVFDLFDLHASLVPTDVHTLHSTRREETSEQVRERVVAARAVQAERARETGCASLNAALTSKDLQRVATLDDAGQRLVNAAMERLSLPARSLGAILRLSRTIADLDHSVGIRAPHVAEAVHGRLLDRPLEG